MHKYEITFLCKVFVYVTLPDSESFDFSFTRNTEVITTHTLTYGGFNFCQRTVSPFKYLSGSFSITVQIEETTFSIISYPLVQKAWVIGYLLILIKKKPKALPYPSYLNTSDFYHKFRGICIIYIIIMNVKF